MSFKIYDVETNKDKEIKMRVYLQPIQTPKAIGNYGLCPICETKISLKEMHALIKRNSPARINEIMGNRKIECLECGTKSKIKYEPRGEGEGIAYLVTSYKLFGKIPIPFIKKRTPLGFNFK